MVTEEYKRLKAKALTTAKVNGHLEPGKYEDGRKVGLFLRVENNG